MSWRSATRRLVPYLVAMAGGFMLSYLVVAFFVFPSGVVPKDEEVPSVVGLAYGEAEAQLIRKGFRVEQGESRVHPAAPKLTVLEQDPPGGGRELMGTTVRLTVSAGPAQ